MNKEVRDIRMVFAVFSIIFFFAAWKNREFTLGYFLAGIGLVLCILLAASPLVLRPLFRIWMRAAKVLGNVNMHILLGLVFAFLFVPIGLCMRLLGKDPMKRKALGGTYWEDYKIQGSGGEGRYEKPY